MAGKQIIDGCDVSGCGYFDGNECMISGLGINDAILYCYCKSNPNCYYKQLKRKEQECERLKEENKEIRKYQYEQDCKEINAELKAENEECIKDNEYLKTIIKDFAQEVVKLKQTLAEIIRFFKEDKKFARYSGYPIVFTKSALEEIEKILKENDIKISECEVGNE